MFRHQLAAYSPIKAAALPSIALAAAGFGPDPRPALATLLATRLGADRVILVDSGTQALQLAISMAVARQAGAERERPIIALPAFSCFDLVSAAVGADVHVAFYDLEPATLSPDLASFDEALAAGARVAVVAPLYGIPVDWEALAAIAVRHGTLLIEDAAQGHGAVWRGTPVGALGEISTISFGRGKGWTGGNGGAVLLRGDGWPQRADLPTHGFAKYEAKRLVAYAAQWLIGRPAVYGLPRAVPSLELGVTRYHEPASPRAISRGAASAVLANCAISDVEAEWRRASARRFDEELANVESVARIRVGPGATPGYLRYPLLVSRGAEGLQQFSALQRFGVERSYPTVLPELRAMRDRVVGVRAADFPGARQLVEQLITLPTHSLLSRAEQLAMIQLLDAQVGEHPFTRADS